MNALKRLSVVWMVGFIFIVLTVLVPLSAAATDEVLTTAAAVRSLPAVDAEMHLPVKLRGVVTFYDDGLFSRFVQDDTAGIYLQVTNTLALQPGQIVEISGVTGAGEFAPVVIPTTIKVVGSAKIPVAKPLTVAELLGGAEDSQLVEVNGNVRAARLEKPTGNYYIDMVADGERITVIAKRLPVAEPNELLDATVRVRGVCSTLFNRQRQLFGVRLLVPDADGLSVVTSAPANPFAAAVEPLDSLLRFTPEGSHSQRIKVRGTVVYFEPGNAVFIEDGNTGLRCQTAMREALHPGDLVEVLGAPAKGDYSPVLEDAIYRKTGSGGEPKPDLVDLNEVLTGAHDCQLVQLSATVLARVDRGVNQFLLLSAGDFVFQAYLPADVTDARFSSLIPGSAVRVTGICLIERGNSWQAGKDWRAKSFRLLLRSPQDVEVVQAVTKSTPEKWLFIVGAMELVIMVVIIRLLVYLKKIYAKAG